MRNAIARQKDFVELSFISALFLGLTLFSSCSALSTNAKAEKARTPSSYAVSITESQDPSTQLQFLRGGREKRN